MLILFLPCVLLLKLVEVIYHCLFSCVSSHIFIILLVISVGYFCFGCDGADLNEIRPILPQLLDGMLEFKVSYLVLKKYDWAC